MAQQFATEADVMVATAGRVDTVNNEVQSELTRLQGTSMGYVLIGRARHRFRSTT